MVLACTCHEPLLLMRRSLGVRRCDIPLYALAYNQFHNSQDATINQDTYQYLCKHLAQYFPSAHIIDIPVL